MDDATVQHLDGAALRALAHPLRMRILRALRAHGAATSTMLGARLGESSGATSYHLRVLAANGLVTEDVARGTARERWWQSTHDETSWRPERFRRDPDERAAEEWLSGYVARQAMEWIDDWMARRPAADAAWLAAAEQSDYLIELTPSQVEALSADLHAVVRRHRDQADQARSSGAFGAEDARPVRILLYAMPDDAPR